MALGFQVATYYPRLRNILVPLPGIISSPFLKPTETTGGRFRPPPRWEEPLIQNHIKSYLKVMSESPFRFNNEDIESDLVYANIVNPDVRKAILQRRMNEKTYRSIEKQLQKVELPALPDGSTSKAITPRIPGKLTTYEEIQRRLNDLPPGLLAVESSLGQQTVKRLLDQGLDGSEIVDLGFTVKKKRTSSESVQRLLQAGIEDWDAIIDAAREIQCTVKLLIDIMNDLGSDSVDEIVRLIDASSSDVSDFAARHRMSQARAWYIFLKIYSNEGRHNTMHALDLLTGTIFSSWHEDTNVYEEF